MEPPNSTGLTSYLNKPPPPVLISGGLPPVPAKLVKRIQDGLFVEMAELLPETLSSPEYAASEEPAGQKQKLREVTNIVDWVQCFGVFIAIISRKEPNRITDLIGYQNLIIQSSIHCQEGRWVIYDRRFRLKASAAIIQEWSTIDFTIWKLAFPECLPGSEKYSAARNPAYVSARQPSWAPPPNHMQPICLEWNETPNPECLCPSCRYNHSCYRCARINATDKNHKAIFCPHKKNHHVAIQHPG